MQEYLVLEEEEKKELGIVVFFLLLHMRGEWRDEGDWPRVELREGVQRKEISIILEITTFKCWQFSFLYLPIFVFKGTKL